MTNFEFCRDTTAFIAKRPGVAYSCSHVLLIIRIGYRVTGYNDLPDVTWEIGLQASTVAS